MQPCLSVLPNGLQVLIQEDHRFPLVVMRLYVQAGSSHERSDEAGISHMLEHMAFKKEGGEHSGQAAREIEAVGGSLNAATGFDQTVYMVDLPAKHWGLGLENLFELCFGPQPGEEALELEKGVVLSELEKNQDNPRHRLFEQVQGSVWKGTGYERPIIGYPDTIKGLSSQKLQEYLSRVYLPQSMLLVVCGQVNQEKVVQKAENLFAEVRTQKIHRYPGRAFEPAANPGPRVSVLETSWKKAYCGLGFSAPSVSAWESPLLELGSYILGGDRSSRWYTKYKYQNRLVEEFGVSPMLLAGQGMIYVQVQLDPQQVKTFWTQWLQDIADLVLTEPSQEELDRAKLNIEQVVLQAKETLSGLASKMGYFQFVEKSLAAEDRYLHQIRKAGSKEVQETMLAVLRSRRMQACFFLPGESGLDVKELENALQVQKNGTKDRLKKRVPDRDTQRARVKSLGRGSRLVLLPDRTLPYIGIDLTWLGGDQFLRQTEQGLAALTARTVTKGAGSRDAYAIRDFLSKRAGYLEGVANRDQISILSKFPARFSADQLSLLQDVVQQPLFDPEEVAGCAFEQANRIMERTDHPLGLLSREIFPFLFPGHPYGYYHLGDPAGLERFVQDDLNRFWGQQRAQPFVLTVCGDFDQGEIEETARLLQKKVGQTRLSLTVPNWSGEKDLELRIEDRNQAHILLAFPVPGLEHPLNASTSLLKKLLAGQDGILFKELRDRKGLGYAVSPMLWTCPGIGLLGFYLGTSEDKVDEAVSGFFKVIVELQEQQIESDRLNRARNLLQAEYHRERQGLISRCSEASDLLSYGLELDHYRNMMDATQEIGPGEIQLFARDYLSWDNKYSIILRTREQGD